MTMDQAKQAVASVIEWQEARRAVLALPAADNSKPLPPERIAAYVRLGKAESDLYAIKLVRTP